jgi:hypothetical protein
VLLVTAAITGACGQSGEKALDGLAAAAPAAARATLDPATKRWPGEPEGFVPLSDQPWDRIVRSTESGYVGRLAARARGILVSEPARGTDWSYLRRSSSKDDDIVADTTAPLSPPQVLRIVFTTDMQRDHEPSVHWISLPKVTEIYSAWWMKLSPNWTCSPAGCGKITFLLPDTANGAGVAYTNLAGSNGSHHVNVATTWPSTGYKFWEPNAAKTRLADDQWYRVEWYVKWASTADAADGIIRWWVNGELNGDYRNVPFQAIRGFVEFQHASTRQEPPPTEQYMYIDQTYVSTSVQQMKQP